MVRRANLVGCVDRGSGVTRGALFVFLGFTALFGVFHATNPNLLGVDGYFHITFSRTLWQSGLPDSIPHLSQTIFAERFVDDHLLFHLMQIPFSALGLILGAKALTAISAGLVFALFYCALKVGEIEWPLAWTLGLACTSQAFISRICLPRVSGLSLCVLLAATILVLRKKDRWLGLLSFLYVWLYGGFPLLLMVVAVAFLVDLFHGLPPRWSLLGWTVGGTVLGLVTHPYFPAHSEFLWTAWTRIELGQFSNEITAGIEDYPFRTTEVVRRALLAWGVSLLVFTVHLLERRQLSREATFLFVVSVVFLVLYMLVRRFVEYWPPFALLFAAYALDPLFRERASWKPVWRRGAALSIVTLTILLGIDNFTNLHAEMTEARQIRNYRGPARFLQQTTAENDIVFHTDWSDFPILYHLNRRNRYIVGLGPHYMHEFSRSTHILWRKVIEGRQPAPSSLIRERFGAKWVFGKKPARLIPRLREDPAASIVYEDDFSVIFRIGSDPEGPV